MDGYVIESNIHFPTDINLLYDSARKSLDSAQHLLNSGMKLSKWRAIKSWYKKVRNSYRHTSEIHRRKGARYKERLKGATQSYLKVNRLLSEKIRQSLEECYVAIASGAADIVQVKLTKVLTYYHRMQTKHMDLVERRIIQGEQIPHSEKLFSIFEPHVEWINKGKLHRNVELGHNTVIATDQYQFILDFEILFKTPEVKAGQEVSRRIIAGYGKQHHIASISFDRGFYSGLVKKELEEFVDIVVMPKKGKKTSRQELEESEPEFKQLKKEHATVEANINQLEHNGLNRCPDKGEHGFRRYVAIGILAYNLQHLGNLLIQQNQAEKKKLKKAA